MIQSDKADVLRQRIALYRSYLREGVSASLARQFLAKIAAAETELAKLAEHDPKPRGDEPDD